jgi:hypothetical protein
VASHFGQMRIVKKILKYFGLGLLLLTVIGVGYFGFRYLTRNMKSDDLITIEATFMQYACGDENDDMQINKVDNKKYKSLIGKDVDPQVTLVPDTYELKDYFYKNRTGDFGLEFRLKGRLSKYCYFGCDDVTPKFWVEEIEMMDGANRMTKEDFEIKWMPN